jgi:hypothetical protein
VSEPSTETPEFLVIARRGLTPGVGAAESHW